MKMKSDGIDLLADLNNIANQLQEELNTLEERGYRKARSEREYKVIARQKALEEKNAGVSVTFISQFIAGEPEVANAKEIRDVEEALYYTSQEKINVLKLQLRIIDKQIDREWSNGGNNFSS